MLKHPLNVSRIQLNRKIIGICSFLYSEFRLNYNVRLIITYRFVPYCHRKAIARTYQLTGLELNFSF